MRITMARPTLQNLANRIEFDRKMLEQHPEHGTNAHKQADEAEKRLLDQKVLHGLTH